MTNTIAFEGSIEGWVANFLKKNFWRVKRTMSYEDVMQEAYAEFLELKTKWYPNITEPKHFMALFKLSWAGHFNDLASRDSSSKMCTSLAHPLSDVDDATIEDLIAGDLDVNTSCTEAVYKLPNELQDFLLIIINAPFELIQVAKEAVGWSDLKQRNLEKKLRSATRNAVEKDLQLCTASSSNWAELNATKQALDALPEEASLAGAIRGLQQYLAAPSV